MNDKNKATEEMLLVMCEEYGKECHECPCADCANEFIAEKLYNAGYRKVDDEELKKFYSLEEVDYWKSRVQEIGDVASKETARELAKTIISSVVWNEDKDKTIKVIDVYRIICDIVKSKHGVEVE